MGRTQTADAKLKVFAAAAQEAEEMLKLLANEGRLLALCHLVVDGELSVGDLADRVGLSQSALSQHLAKMWDGGLVARRREGQTVFYRIGDARVRRVLNVLRDIYCP